LVRHTLTRPDRRIIMRSVASCSNISVLPGANVRVMPSSWIAARSDSSSDARKVCGTGEDVTFIGSP
jgi:hypothetical protein